MKQVVHSLSPRFLIDGSIKQINDKKNSRCWSTIATPTSHCVTNFHTLYIRKAGSMVAVSEFISVITGS